jgi:hypothetical protein
MPLDAARAGLIELQGQLTGVLAVRNAALAERMAQLEAANAELAERLATLERAVSCNSGNSSMPPSSDDRPGRKPPQPAQRDEAQARQAAQDGGGVHAVERSPGRHHRALPGGHLRVRQEPGRGP